MNAQKRAKITKTIFFTTFAVYSDAPRVDTARYILRLHLIYLFDRKRHVEHRWATFEDYYLLPTRFFNDPITILRLYTRNCPSPLILL